MGKCIGGGLAHERSPRHRHRRLTVRTARDGDRALVEIGDNGPGIPQAAAHILKPFYTTKPATAW